jgi:hypothetical protein
VALTLQLGDREEGEGGGGKVEASTPAQDLSRRMHLGGGGGKWSLKSFGGGGAFESPTAGDCI